MARLTFEATNAACEANRDAMVCGVADEQGGYLLFQRSLEPAANDAGVHLEYSDQLNGAYGCIRRCTLTRTQLSVDLLRQLGNLAGVEGLDVRLQVADADYARLLNGLQRIFRDQPDVLTIG